MKKKLKYFLALMLSFLPIVVFAAGTTTYVNCGGITIPAPITGITRSVFLILQICVPIGIIVMGSVDFLKAVIASDSEKIKKNQKKFISRLLAGALVFFVLVIIRLVINIADSSTSNYANCLNCLINNNDGCNASTDSPFSSDPTFSKPSDDDSSDDDVDDSDSKTYEKVIYVGDSRTVGMCDTANVDCEESVAKESQGYSWFVNTAISQTDSKLNNSSGKNYNIVILMGVNGVGKNGSEASKYFNKYKELATGKWKKHNLVIVSVNPVVDGKSTAYMSGVNAFNSTMKQSINTASISNLSYCDTLNGIGKSNFVTTDGLHYNASTYKKIYDYIEKNCLK